MVEFLVNNGADVNALNPVGHTALTKASRYGHIEIVEFLLKNGADTERSSGFYNYTPLMAAAVGNKPVIGELLIQKGAKINTTDSINNFTPVIWAVVNNNVEFIKMIVKYNPDINIVSKYGFKAEDIASEEMMEILGSN
jgi:ankyrin repeat protein